MRKVCLLLLVGFLFITGCENKEEEEKNQYIAMKSDLLENTDYTVGEDLPLDIIVSLDRLNEEEVIYKVSFENPKENLNHMKAMVVHNYYNEDTFPSIGLFDESKNLLLNQEETDIVELKDTIKTTKNISKLNLELKIWIEYVNDNGEVKDIYYKTT